MTDAVSAASAKLTQAIADVQAYGKALVDAATAAVQLATPANPAVPTATVSAMGGEKMNLDDAAHAATRDLIKARPGERMAEWKAPRS